MCLSCLSESLSIADRIRARSRANFGSFGMGYAFEIRTRQRLPAGRRSAAGDREARRGLPRGPAVARPCSAPPAPARRSRSPTSSPQLEQADARPLAQQDARRPALQGVQGLLPAQRRLLLRQLLRLLPARGVHPAARHLHRKRRLDQREHRPPAAGGDQRPGQPRGRDHRRQRLVHLRPRLARATTSG